MKNIWNVILYKLNENQLVSPKNNPTKSGRYLCTCVRKLDTGEIVRYLQIMEYNVKKNYWHDLGNSSGISHNILAWTDKVSPCDFENYDYSVGGYFVEKQ